MVEKRMWADQHCLAQFENIKPSILAILKRKDYSIEQIRESTAAEMGKNLK